ncbi:Mcm10/DnaG-type zinc finger protein [Gammaproteobacteria bacterium]|nr:Mcm10/DnaG-type zinc finger protein [Gammaproteobacteria bacterium]
MPYQSEKEKLDRREALRQKRSKQMKEQHESGQILPATVYALRMHGRCTATARHTGQRCKMFARPNSKFCKYHIGRGYTKPKNKSHYYRKESRRQLYESMKADRAALPELLDVLSAENRRLIAQQTAPYIVRVSETHNDAQGLLLFLEQKIILAAIQAVEAVTGWRAFHETAESLAAGTHELPIRLADGSYASDDRWTLPKGTVVSKTDITHLPDVAGARQKLARVEAATEAAGPSAVTAAELGIDWSDFRLLAEPGAWVK